MHVMILTALVASAVGASAFAPSVPHALARNAMPLALRSRPGLQGLNMKEPNLGLAEPYIGSVPEAKKVFAFLQSKDNSLLSADQTKQLKDVEKQIGDAIEKVKRHAQQQTFWLEFSVYSVEHLNDTERWNGGNVC
jgi:hypothetical protein